MKKRLFTGYKILKNLYIGSIEINTFNCIPKNINTDTYYYYFYSNDSKVWNIPQICQLKDPFEKKHIQKGLSLMKEVRAEFEPINMVKEILKNFDQFNELLGEINELESKLENKLEKRLNEEEIRKLGSKFIVKKRKELLPA